MEKCELCGKREVYCICNLCLAEVCEECAHIFDDYVFCTLCCPTEEEAWEVLMELREGYDEQY